MKKTVLLTAVIFISLVVLTIFLMAPLGWKANLISPMSQKTGVDIISTPAPTSNKPQIFKFDKSTNLKEELEKINPQVLDSDFE